METRLALDQVCQADRAVAPVTRVNPRREGDAWKAVCRHADPIATADPQGPSLRS